MNEIDVDAHSSVALVRDYIHRSGLGRGDRLPPERKLALELSMTRATLRQALGVLEITGEIDRHVGRGTFVQSNGLESANVDAFALVASMTNPYDVIDARLALEPEIAYRAALRARKLDHIEMEKILRESEGTDDPVLAQKQGDAIHRAFAVACHNPLLLALFDAVYSVRRETSWGQLQPHMMPPDKLYEIWCKHRDIAEAVADRNAPLARQRMLDHIQEVHRSIGLG